MTGLAELAGPAGKRGCSRTARWRGWCRVAARGPWRRRRAGWPGMWRRGRSLAWRMWRGRWRRRGRCSSTAPWSWGIAGRTWRRGWPRWRPVSPRPESSSGVATGRLRQGRVVFVFPGQGGQWAGMGRDLAVSCPVFAARLAACGRALGRYVDWDLEQVLAARGAAGPGRCGAAGVVGGDGVAGRGLAGRRRGPGRGGGPFPGRDRRGHGRGHPHRAGRGHGRGAAQPGAGRPVRPGRHGLGRRARRCSPGRGSPPGESGWRWRR